jgi:phosphoribosyl 1,2-cyclic phosphodiesterase
VDLLALEFNHDVEMQRSSGRHPMLIARCLGDEGHLSNEQAAELLSETIRRSTARRLRQLIQLHLSRQCNRPSLAQAAAQSVIDAIDLDIAIHTALQDRPSPAFECGAMTLDRIA